MCLTKSTRPPLYWNVWVCCFSSRSIGEDDLEALVEERHRLQALEHGASHELGALSLEDHRIGVEHDRCAVLAPTLGRVAHDLHLALRLAALGVLLEVALAATIDFDREPLRQGVDDRHADAVQAAGDLVALAAELATGVEHREHHLSGALALVRARWVRIDGDTATVVVDTAATVGLERDVDPIAVTGHRLVDGVVDDLPDQVVQAGEAG